MSTAEMLNGVDVSRLVKTVTAVKANPELAKCRFRARTEWDTGGHSRTTIQNFYGVGQEDTSRSSPFILEGDEPNVLLGSNVAPNAVEAALHALTSCLTVGFAYNAAARGIQLDELWFDVEGELDLQAFLGLSEEVRPGYSAIRLTCHVKADAPRAQLEELCDYVQKTSPVMDIIRNPVHVSAQLAD